MTWDHRTPIRLRDRRVAVLLAALLALAGRQPAMAASHDSAPPLPPPSGHVVHVSTEPQLQAAIASLTSGTTVVIAPGVYTLTSTLWINRAVTDVVIRGESNNRDDVVLAGPGMTNAVYGGVPHGIWTGGGVTRVTIANLTIRDVYFHPLIFNSGTQEPRVYNVRLLDAGDQFLKSNPTAGGGGVNGGVVEYSVFEYTTVARDSYTNGVDVHAGRDWVIRHNLFRRIRSTEGLAGPAILMWNHSANTVVEGNTFIDCHRDISLGLVVRAAHDHEGGVIRNNVILRTPGAGGDVGIAVFDSPGTRVLHNTILLNGAYGNAIEYRFAATTGVMIANNLADRPALARENATATLSGNVWTATPAWFADPNVGNFHLAASATEAIDAVTPFADALTDWDGEARPSGTAADVGADELQTGEPPPPTEICGDDIDNDGDELVDEGCALGAIPVPGAPSALVGWVAGSTVSLSWLAPISGGSVTGYVLEAGVSRGSTLLVAPLGSVTATMVPGVGAGTYFVRVRAVNVAGQGPATDDVAVSVGCTAAPAAPRAMTAAAEGHMVSLRWVDDEGCADTRYRLMVGSAPGQSNLGVLTTTSPMLLAAAPPGRYYIRVLTERGGRASAPSNEVNVVASHTCAPPVVAMMLTGSAAWRRLDLRWTPSSPSAAASIDARTPLSYVLEAGRTPHASDLGVFPMGRTTGLNVSVPPGPYYVRVRATSVCGAGPASNDLALVVQ